MRKTGLPLTNLIVSFKNQIKNDFEVKCLKVIIICDFVVYFFVCGFLCKTLLSNRINKIFDHVFSTEKGVYCCQ